MGGWRMEVIVICELVTFVLRCKLSFTAVPSSGVSVWGVIFRLGQSMA